MLVSHLLLFAGWVLYGILHSVFASPGFKQMVAQRWKGYQKYYRLLYATFAFASLVFMIWFQLSTSSALLYQDKWLRLVTGFPLTALGGIIMLICSSNYLLHILGLESILKKGPSPVLKTDGLHRYVRHPLYLGTFLFIIGLFCWFPSVANLLAIIAIIGYTLIAIPVEEKKLVLEFGNAYRKYQQRVPKIIPFTR